MSDFNALNIRRLNASDSDFSESLSRLVEWSALADVDFEKSVREILYSVRQQGDKAVLDYTVRFDAREVASIDQLVIEKPQLEAAFEGLDKSLKASLEQAANRITVFHEKQKQASWQYTDSTGALLGQQVTALDRVGIYVPGGKAAYPSSVLMNAMPAKVAGVAELVMCSPAPRGDVNQTVLAAAYLAGVDRVYTVGGAQAVAAMAYGTQTVPRVDKIVGPGNRFVACAKKMVFGEVGLDMVAGPSEILIVCDGKTDPDWIAMDMFSQAEHDEDAQAILIATSNEYLEQVALSINKLLPTMSREAIIRESLSNRGAFILVEDLPQAMDIVNRIAPEHLELSVDEAEQWLSAIWHAGAIFLGRHTPEALGDYCAGPNHVLPTSTTARFASPLGVYDFQKRSSIIGCSPESAAQLSECAATLADSESLTAHAASARYRS